MQLFIIIAMVRAGLIIIVIIRVFPIIISSLMHLRYKAVVIRN